MRVLVVIVNYRSAGLVVDCLRSLESEVRALGGPAAARVVVTDNASGDDSVPVLTAAVRDNGWGEWATVQPLPRNGGFAYGNNEAIRPALVADAGEKPVYVLLLNPDTVIRPGAISSLLVFMDAHPRVGIAGSRLEHPDGTPQPSAFRFHSVFSEFENGLRLGLVSRLLRRFIVARPIPQAAAETDWVSGASFCVRRAVFEDVGLLDEGYFMYFEEAAFALKARRAGWASWYVPESRVVHLVGQSSGITQRQKRRPAYWFDSRRRYFVTNHGRAKAVLADAAWATGFALFKARAFLQRKPVTDPPMLLRDFVRNSALFR